MVNEQIINEIQNLKLGEVISEEVLNFISSIKFSFYSTSLIQLNEGAYDSKGRELYRTFKRTGKKWIHQGFCLKGKNRIVR